MINSIISITNSEIRGTANFSIAHFQKTFIFVGAKVCGNAYFDRVEFSENADFGEAIFFGEADFVKAEFDENARFWKAGLAGRPTSEDVSLITMSTSGRQNSADISNSEGILVSRKKN